MRFSSRIFLVLILSILVSSCGKKADNNRPPLADRKINIVTTTGMITDAVRQIGGERVDVKGLMGPGIDPHLYKASEGDVSKMLNADVIFYNGLHLEGALTDVFEKMQTRVKTSAVADGIDPARLLTPAEFEGAHDPHVWFDVSMWINAAERIREQLIALDPQSADLYRGNAAVYIDQLRQLHEYVIIQAESIPENLRVVVTAHDAFNYFGRAYGFEVRGLQGISTVSEAGTADVQNLADFIASRSIPAIFVESSVPRRAVEALQAAVRSRGFNVEIGGELYSDAMGTPGTEAENYLGMVKHNIDTITNALKGNVVTHSK
ncbi:zinc ABC transporter substrate-binding protein [bacterium]|nr:zinc ABC transporter substrate-binding protein [bacterium]